MFDMMKHFENEAKWCATFEFETQFVELLLQKTKNVYISNDKVNAWCIVLMTQILKNEKQKNFEQRTNILNDMMTMMWNTSQSAIVFETTKTKWKQSSIDTDEMMKNNFISQTREKMKKKTYTIPAWMNYTMCEIEYVQERNKAFFEITWRETNFKTQTYSNTLKTLCEQAHWKYWYVLMNDTIIIQIFDYWKDQRMQELWFTTYLNERPLTDKTIERLKEKCNEIFNKFVENMSKIEWVKIEESE